MILHQTRASHRLLSISSAVKPTILSTRASQHGWNQLSSILPSSNTDQRRRASSSTQSIQHTPNNNNHPIKIGIVGGGIMGITVAHSLLENICKNPNNLNCQVILFEGDQQAVSEFNQNKSSPSWKAATARNANTIAVGSSMHVFSSRKMVYELVSNALGDVKRSLQQAVGMQVDTNDSANPNNAFSKPPPFFSFQPYYCLGPGARSWEERRAFLAFGFTYLYHALIKGDAPTCHERAQVMVQLAQATRHKFLEEIAPTFGCTSNWYTEGLLSVHRTRAQAQEVLDECAAFGLPAQLLDWEQALKQEPRLRHLPIDSLYVVQRPLDIAANCEQYMRLMLEDCLKHDTCQHQVGKVTSILEHPPANEKSPLPKYTITNDQGYSTEVDLVVLAAGAYTPLLAQTLGVARQIPTFPLRGVSYTLTTRTTSWGHGSCNHLFQTALTMDGLYMSSVKPWMARLTGFGELAGFGSSAKSKAPGVLQQYASALFGDVQLSQDTQPVPCFRPMSPDDLPMVGFLEKGIFVHTGHGTLGWTTAFATSECLSQEILDYLTGQDRATFELPDGTTLEKARISPNRFRWW